MADAVAQVGVTFDDSGMRTLADALGSVRDSASDAKGGLEGLGSGAETATGSTGRLSGALSSMKTPLTAVAAGIAAAGAAAVAAAVGLGKMALDVARMADESAKAASAVGMSVESYTALDHAMQMSGTSMEEQKGAMASLNRQIVDGSDALTGLGISTRDASGEIRSSEDVMADLADRFSTMEDGAEKSAAAVALFGESGTAMIPMLNEGSAGITEMTDEAERLGLVMSGETAAASTELNDNISRLKGIFEGVKNIISSAIIPVMSQVSSVMVNAFGPVTSAVSDSSGMIERLAETVGRFVLGALSAAVKGVGIAATIFGNLQIVGSYLQQGFISLGLAIQTGFTAVMTAAIRIVSDFLGTAADLASVIPGMGGLEAGFRGVSDAAADMAEGGDAIVASLQRSQVEARASGRAMRENIEERTRAITHFTAEMADSLSSGRDSIGAVGDAAEEASVSLDSVATSMDAVGTASARANASVPDPEEGTGLVGWLRAVAEGIGLVSAQVPAIESATNALRALGLVPTESGEIDLIQRKMEMYPQETEVMTRELKLQQMALDESVALKRQREEEDLAHEEKVAERRRTIAETSVGLLTEGAQRLGSQLANIEGKNRKERLRNLRKGLGQELVSLGAQLVAKGIGQLISLNPMGALSIAGGVSMIAAGRKMGGGGGGGGGAKKSAPAQAPQQTSNVTVNQTTNFGFVGDRRAAARDVSRETSRAVALGADNRSGL